MAAARAVAAGHEVVGVHMALSKSRESSRMGARGCCTIEDATDASRAASILGIPYYVWDLSDRFLDDVIADFVSEYQAGHTPNPCARCNERIKFAALLDKAQALGFDAVATGHYARVGVDVDGLPGLWRAADGAKDQSYVLAVVPRDRLSHAMFPLADAPTKAAVREEARALGLPLSEKPDSHDICFIADGNTKGFLQSRVPHQPGPIVAAGGVVVGEHDGAVGYTLGQRKGLRLGHPAPDGKPRYVLDVSVRSNTVTVGSADELLDDSIAGGPPTWLATPPAPGSTVSAQWRAHGTPVPAVVEHAGHDGVSVRLTTPAPRVAPGQTLALYEGDRVLGSATVTRGE